jgi:hypothetical protein
MSSPVAGQLPTDEGHALESRSGVKDDVDDLGDKSKDSEGVRDLEVKLEHKDDVEPKLRVMAEVKDTVSDLGERSEVKAGHEKNNNAKGGNSLQVFVVSSKYY